MEDNNKLFVFEKKEVVLIFLFIILISVISFTLGVRTGKELSLKHDNYTQQDINNINLKSVEEEYVEDVVKEAPTDFEKSMKDSNEEGTPAATETATSDMEQRLKEEMEKLANEDVKVAPVPKKTESAPVTKPEQSPVPQSATKDSEFTGKYTIQLFSHQSQDAAHEFADVFRLKGYDVIINEVVIPGKGKWYRVSIGIFENVNQAKDYLNKEKNLFQSNKYIIQQI